MEARAAGYREIAHTADWELEAWASDLPGLLEQAARGMYALAGAQLQDAPRITRKLSVHAPDPESLLVSFLSELLYMGEREQVGFDRFALKLDGMALQAELEGAPLQALAKEIKAVTYHRLAIRSEAGGLRVRIVFDV